MVATKSAISIPFVFLSCLAAGLHPLSVQAQQSHVDASVDCSKPVQNLLPVSTEDFSETDVVDYTRDYVDKIQRKIENNWLIPMRPVKDFQCTVFVRQREDGCVLHAAVQNCEGQYELVRSVMSAVRRASPLPRAHYREMFESDIVLTFRRPKSQ